MIYRLAEAADWAAAQRNGFFASPDLAAEGFIHFSERHQVQGVAERYYAGKTGLVLLAVDETKLGGVPLKRENTSGGTELFPHVYGRGATRGGGGARSFRPRRDGQSHLACGLVATNR